MNRARVGENLAYETFMSQQAGLKLSDLRAAHRVARRQAKLRRVLSPYAFAGALDQPMRWHLFYDKKRVVSVICSGTDKERSWSAGPVMSVAELEEPETLQARCKELLQQQKQTGLGVVLHLADQLDQGIVQEEFAQRDEKQRDAGVTHPARLLFHPDEKKRESVERPGNGIRHVARKVPGEREREGGTNGKIIRDLYVQEQEGKNRA